MTRAVALFTYNRPQKTRRVLEALRHQLNGPLYVFCDGNKAEYDRISVQKTIQVAQRFPYPEKEVFIAKENKGLAVSILNGISDVFHLHEELIVLEDDCLPLPGMLRFMDKNLSRWKDCRSIFSISAHHFIRDEALLTAYPYNIFSSQRFLCWGWATWRDRWMDILEDLKNWQNPFGSFREVPFSAGRDLPFHAYCFEKQQVDSWAIPVALATLKKGYHHIMPTFPFIYNIGLDGSGTHCGVSSNDLPNENGLSGAVSPGRFPFAEKDNQPMLEAFNESMLDVPPWFWQILHGNTEQNLIHDIN